MAWTPHNPEKQALQLSALTGKGNFYNTGSPPPTPSAVHEPMERRNRDDYVEMANERDDSNRAGVIHPSPSCNSIMSMEDDDFASDDEKVNYSSVILLGGIPTVGAFTVFCQCL